MTKSDTLLDIKDKLSVNGLNYTYISLKKAQRYFKQNIQALPFSLKILLENLLRHFDNYTVTGGDLKAIDHWLEKATSEHEIAFYPTRVLMQDFTGVPAIVDLAAMRTQVNESGNSPTLINPLTPVDLIIDHSVEVEEFGTPKALSKNTTIEITRNRERYEFLKWAQKAFQNFRVVPPGTGICHQVNLEYLAKVVWHNEETNVVYPDTLVGTDSHTTMINGLSVLGWGVGGIEAEAAMLGQPVSLIIPEVVGFKLYGQLREGITATDLVLSITEILRIKGVVGKFVEFFGPGLASLSLADRATIANMAPEYGATCGYFPIDAVTLDYLTLTGRSQSLINLIHSYALEQGLWCNKDSYLHTIYTDVIELNLTAIEPSLAGPKRPQDRVSLSQMPSTINETLKNKKIVPKTSPSQPIQHADVVIAAITSCTNTSNPNILITAGLLAKNACEKGLKRKPWVKTSLAPGSKVVTDYLEKTGLQTYLDSLGFNVVGYGCTTCIGNSGPLAEEISKEITENNLFVSAVLSGNRNFEGRIHPHVKMNWLASPPLVIAFALAGTTYINLLTDSLGKDKNGNEVYLKDIWPSDKEVNKLVKTLNAEMFQKHYSVVFEGNKDWKNLKTQEKDIYEWNEQSTYIQYPPFFIKTTVNDIINGRILAILGDSITTDHISPAGSIAKNSPAGLYLQEKNIEVKEFNSYGSRRGNHEVMLRGTFSNIRLKNEMLPGTEGGYTIHYPSQIKYTIYDAAMRYLEEKTPLIIFAGKEYGTGSSRDWAAKGTFLLGVRAVIAESFERIHRSNLIGMGVLPLQFSSNFNRTKLNLQGNELISIESIQNLVQPKQIIPITIQYSNGEKSIFPVLTRIDTQKELEYFQSNGILNYVLNSILHK